MNPTVEGAGQPRRRGARRVLQGGAFLACLLIMAWVVHRAMTSPGSAEQLERLRSVSAGSAAVLLICSLATIVIGGLFFRATLSAHTRLPRTNVVALNGVISLLSYLPFKAGLAFRVYWHHRRDGVPLLTIAAWFAASAGVILAGLAPPLCASVWRGQVDGWWWAVSIGGTALSGVLIVVCSRVFAGEGGIARLAGWARAARLSPLARVVEGGHFRRLHAGFMMLAAPAAVAEALALRTLDVGAQATRLYVAAGVCGVTLTPGQAVLAGTLYFFFQATSPGGVAGAREGGTVAVMAWMGIPNLPDLSVVVLTASLAEVAMNVACAGAGALWLARSGRARSVDPADQSSSSPSSS
ncbi:MAG: hypothetical protein ACT4PL_11160 [Phycisphaerales bacterium]